VTEGECRGVVVLDEPYQGAEVLDRKYKKPEPLFSRKALAELRARTEQALVESLRSPMPVRAPSLTRGLSLLRARKRRQPKGFAAPARAKVLHAASGALGQPIPEAWQKVLRVCNGGRIENCELASGMACTIIPIERVSQQWRQEADYYRQVGAAVQDSFMLVMQTEVGDSIWLDTARLQSEGDCRVVLLSHETGGEERTWPSIAEFLEELLASE
jgi:hypothetical protein